MSRWQRRDDDLDKVTIEQFELKFQEECVRIQKMRDQGVPWDRIPPIRPRKLSPIEVRYLELKAERRALERELHDAGW